MGYSDEGIISTLKGSALWPLPHVALLVLPIHVLPTVSKGVPCHIHLLKAEIGSGSGSWKGKKHLSVQQPTLVESEAPQRAKLTLGKISRLRKFFGKEYQPFLPVPPYQVIPPLPSRDLGLMSGLYTLLRFYIYGRFVY